MKSILIIILSLSFSIAALGQDYPDSGFTNKTEAKNQLVNGKKEGKWVEYIDSGLSITTDTNSPFYQLSIYSHDEPFGIVRAYFKSGKILWEDNYSEGKLNGVIKVYYENGKLRSILTYKDGNLQAGKNFKEDGSEIK